MSRPDANEARSRPAEDGEGQELPRWPADWRELLPLHRWLWFERLWQDTCRLRLRYRLPIRAGWWEDGIQVEALATLAAWVERYDCGEWEDPPGKLALLYDLERLSILLRDGNQAFHPERDHPAFVGYLSEVGAEPPPSRR